MGKIVATYNSWLRADKTILISSVLKTNFSLRIPILRDFYTDRNGLLSEGSEMTSHGPLKDINDPYLDLNDPYDV